MDAKPLNNTTIQTDEFFYNKEKSTFEQVIIELFKNYIKTCGNSDEGGEKK